VVQATLFDPVSVDPFAFEQDCLAASEVNVVYSTHTGNAGSRRGAEKPLCNRIASLRDLTHGVALKIFAEIRFAHDALPASKLGKKASANLGPIQVRLRAASLTFPKVESLSKQPGHPGTVLVRHSKLSEIAT
jgi:hypothetical protein